MKQWKMTYYHPFWTDAHNYAFSTGEEDFIHELAFIMTELHDGGYE